MVEANEQSQHPHEEWESLAAISALDGLAPDDEQRLAAHLAECASCRASYSGYQLVAGKLAEGVPQVIAPPYLEARLRAAVHKQQTRRLPWSNARSWALAAAAVFLAVALGVQNLQLRNQLAIQAAYPTIAAVTAPDAQPIVLTSSSSQATAGRFIWSPHQPIASLALVGLPKPASGRTYQLWFVQKDGTTLSGGTFSVDADGVARVPITTPAPWSTYRELFITEEPGSGSAQPTSTPALTGQFTV